MQISTAWTPQPRNLPEKIKAVLRERGEGTDIHPRREAGEREGAREGDAYLSP